MATTFSSLPIVDLEPLRSSSELTPEQFSDLGKQLYNVFATTGFAYLVNLPLSFDHEDVFRLAREFFVLPEEEKMILAKKSFVKEHSNTYRGYFPTQPELASDNLKEGFEMGPAKPVLNKSNVSKSSKFNLSEPNIWPSESVFGSREQLEKLYAELQSLASTLLSLLAVSLGKKADFFAPYLEDSVSTLRLLHYPPVPTSSASMHDSKAQTPPPDAGEEVKLSCTPHTDSGILTLLHQDPSGGLEAQDAEGKWVPAPYVPGSIVVNIGDLMADVSGGRFVATMHRVRAPRPVPSGDGEDDATVEKFGRFSVPFFFEPGERCVVKSVDDEHGQGVVYGDHVRAKMKTWVEFNDDDAE